MIMKRKSVIIICFLFLCVGAYFGMNEYFKNMKYHDAIKFAKMNDERHAYEVLLELGDYKDSSDRCNEYIYSKAVQFIDEGRITKAYLLLDFNREYKNCSQLLHQLENEEPLLQVLKLNEGESFLFGEYEQDNNIENGKEPIEWILLSKKNGDIYALSRYVLDTLQFNDSDKWSASIYNWMENGFLNIAFTKSERDDISRICLLKNSEVRSEENSTGIVSADLSVEFTEYALSKKPFIDTDSGLQWWMEAECGNASECRAGHTFARTGASDGSTSHLSEVTNRCGFRPAIWILTDEEDLPAETLYDGS